MNDTVKGISILAVTTVAIFGVLRSDDHGWNIPFFVNNTAEQAEVMRLQASILSGEDPTSIQEAAAAGLSDALSCNRGWISVDEEALKVEKWPYISIANQSSMYIRLIDRKIILEIAVDDKTIARHVKSIPVDIAMQFSDIAEQRGECERKNLIVSSLK